MDGLAKFLTLCILLVSTILFSTALDTLSPGQSIKDGQTIISASQSFELGFFSPGSSTNRFVGVWYKKLSTGTIAWVANREAPLFDQSGVLSITAQGVLVLVNGTNNVVWSSNGTRTSNNPIAQLLETGNLVVIDASDGSKLGSTYIWQSFDYPCDTFLPEMKLGVNFVTGLDRHISSWKSYDNPSRGDITFSIDPHGYPQLTVKKAGVMQYRLGSWNGIRFSGSPRLRRTNPVYTYDFVLNRNEVYYSFGLVNSSVPSRFVVNASGLAERLTWMDQTSNWIVFFSAGEDQCDDFAMCGANAVCNINRTPVCACLEGFEPKSARDWSLQAWSGGCVRNAPLGCHNGEGFVKYEGLKLPDTSSSWFDRNMTLRQCDEFCLKNCSCVAYSNTDVTAGGSGCLLWFGDLIDMREYAATGEDLYIRMPASYLEYMKERRKSRERKKLAIIICSVLLVTGALILGLFIYIRKSKLRDHGKIKSLIAMYSKNKKGEEDLELPIIDLRTLLKATHRFSVTNKLGEGGFGSVFKGTLLDGSEIAVKRLSLQSGQGVEEFINEAILIARLQHRNLVKLIGCCIERNERILVYEYMQNRSLDYFIFNESNSRILNWQMRIHIIDGAARGILYLHEDSRLRIIHRDLKASNILLDDQMNPKISDFGMARMFGGNQIEANTNKIVGTYGYMAPEYASDGIFSVKSDVFSFGVLILEIVSGCHNRGFQNRHHRHNLLGHVWKLWMEERIHELIDDSLGEHCPIDKIIRRIHVGLLCVQQQPEDRPNMSIVVLMLGSQSTLPQPKQPGFFTERNEPESDSSTSNHLSNSVNEMTISLLEPR